MLPTILFDLDGTLLNTLEDLTSSVNHALTSCALPAVTQQQVRPLLGNGIRALVAGCVPMGEGNPVFERCFAAFCSHYNLHCGDLTRPYDGIETLLQELKARGASMALVTNKVNSAAQALWRQYFSQTLSLAIGMQDGLARKPAADMPLLALQRLEKDPKSAVYIGDSEVDFLTARAAGLRCILVTWGFRDREQLQSLQPDALCDTPEELLHLLCE